MSNLTTLHRALTQAGKAHGLRPFGSYAMNSMRLEKGYRAWGLDLTTERTPLEAGLGSLVRTAKRCFCGREVLLERARSPTRWRMALLALEPQPDFDPFYLHPVWQGDRAVGIVTSGAPAHRTDTVLSLAYLRPDAGDGEFEVSVLGRRVAARELAEPPYDPSNLRLRGAGAPAPKVAALGGTPAPRP